MLKDSEYAPWFADKALAFEPSRGYCYIANSQLYWVHEQIWAMATAEGKRTGSVNPPPLAEVLEFARDRCSPDIRKYCEGLLCARSTKQSGK